MNRCEDYPCCGHNDGLGCDWVAPDYSNDPHLLCDHENGYCEVAEQEEYDHRAALDDEEYDEELAEVGDDDLRAGVYDEW